MVAIAYHSRHKIHLADFTWKRFVSAVGQANIFLLLLCLVGIYGCYAIRAVRWQRFCKYVGPTTFMNTYAGTLMGFAAIFILGRAGEPVRPLILARKERLPVSSRRLASRKFVRKQLPGVPVMSAPAAGIDAKYVVAASEPGPHGIEPAVFVQPSLLGSIRLLVLKGPHARTTAIPTPRKRPMTRKIRPRPPS